MTHRERLERKAERRREWAEKRTKKAEAVFAHNEPYTSDHAFNTQPGHIPARARIIAQEDRAYESLAVAKHHESTAAGIQDHLDRSIFSDDHNALEALQERITANEAKRDRGFCCFFSCSPFRSLEDIKDQIVEWAEQTEQRLDGN